MGNIFIESNRWKHFVCAIALGFVSNTIYCASLVGFTAAGCLELKDTQNGKNWENWDWLDFGFTIAGTAVGYLLRLAVLQIAGNAIT